MADHEFLIKAEKVTVNKSAGAVLKDISFGVKKGNHLAITGASGSGKTTLGMCLAGRMFFRGKLELDPAVFQSIAWVEQQHHFRNLSNTSDFYYQQRFNSYDSEDAQTVKEVLEASGGDWKAVLEVVQIEYLASKPMIQLSNGENKKLQIASALLSSPSVLIMDQPFVGLDTDTRGYVHDLINRLAGQGIFIILITTPDELPSCITQVLYLENGNLLFSGPKEDFAKETMHQRPAGAISLNEEMVRTLMAQTSPLAFSDAIRMEEVKVEYDGKKILDGINWQVKNGERWLLSGPNGAGKSTLLSLVTADNPQAYANHIWLFDKRRGSGESIWDIKKKIGYLSPELHVFFERGCTCFEAVASGLFDTIGLFRQLSEQDIQWVQEWLSLLGMESLSRKRLFELSIGQQRIVLLARALVKNPPLLILDEPCQGLDSREQKVLHELIDMVCEKGNKTMVFVTHYTNERPACINRFIKIEKGKRVE